MIGELRHAEEADITPEGQGPRSQHEVTVAAMMTQHLVAGAPNFGIRW